MNPRTSLEQTRLDPLPSRGPTSARSGEMPQLLPPVKLELVPRTDKGLSANLALLFCNPAGGRGIDLKRLRGCVKSAAGEQRRQATRTPDAAARFTGPSRISRQRLECAMACLRSLIDKVGDEVGDKVPGTFLLNTADSVQFGAAFIPGA